VAKAKQQPTNGARGARPKKMRLPKPPMFDWSKFDPSMAHGAGAAELAVHLVTYRDQLKELLRDKGKYVLIKGDEVIGIYDEKNEALREAVARFQDQPVLVKRIAAKERIHTLGGAEI
jgi:hypothetical protein